MCSAGFRGGASPVQAPCTQAHMLQGTASCFKPATYSFPATASPAAQMLKRLPTSLPRGLALQQLSGALLVEKIIPSKGADAAPSAVQCRAGSALDPTTVIAAQPWWAGQGGVGWGCFGSHAAGWVREECRDELNGRVGG